MTDILLEENGDIKVTEDGDILITDSIKQAVCIRLRWIYEEWRLNPEYGLTWFEDILVKNPDMSDIKNAIKEEAEKVEGVTKATIDNIEYDRRHRTLAVKFHFSVGEEVYYEEVTFNE